METQNTDNLSVSSIAARAVAPTPPFWKKFRNIALMIGTLAGGVVAVASTGGVALPAVVITVAKVVAGLATYGAAQAQLTTTNQPAESEVSNDTGTAAQ